MVDCEYCGEETGENEIFVLMQTGYKQGIFFCDSDCHSAYFGQ